MELNYHNCGVGDARLQRLVQEAFGQPAPAAASNAAGAVFEPLRSVREEGGELLGSSVQDCRWTTEDDG